MTQLYCLRFFYMWACGLEEKEFHQTTKRQLRSQPCSIATRYTGFFCFCFNETGYNHFIHKIICLIKKKKKLKLIWKATVGFSSSCVIYFPQSCRAWIQSKNKASRGHPPIHIQRSVLGQLSKRLRQTGGTPRPSLLLPANSHKWAEPKPSANTRRRSLPSTCHNGSGPDNLLMRKPSYEREMLSFIPGNVLIHPPLQHTSFLHVLQAYRISNNATSYWPYTKPHRRDS